MKREEEKGEDCSEDSEERQGWGSEGSGGWRGVKEVEWSSKV